MDSLRAADLRGCAACSGEADFSAMDVLRSGGVRWEDFGVAGIFPGEGALGATEGLRG